ncbi:MAG TPA: O-antigen ligase family protein, partial [Victivallales bacterium]|nr:O-antigen ligase family protein [Victivallales bacterium]
IHHLGYLFTIFCLYSLPINLFSGNFEQTVEKYRNFLEIPHNSPFLSIYLLLGFLLILLSFFKPKIALGIMLVFIMVSTDIQLDKTANSERGVTVRMEDIILLLVTGGWLLNRAKNRSLSIIKDVPINKGITVMSFAIIISTLLGLLQGTVPTSRAILFTLKRLEYFWIYFMTLHMIDTREETIKMFRFLFFISLFIACFGIIQSFLFPVSPLTGGGITATAGFGRANTLASFYLIMAGISIGMLLYYDSKSQIFYLFSLTIFIVAIILTKSRGAYVSILPILIMAYLISRRTKLLFFTVSVLAIIGLFYIGTFISGKIKFLAEIHNDNIKSQFISIGSVVVEGPEADSSFYARYSAWKDIFPKIMDYPLFGHGVGAMFLGYVDNQYFHELYDTGFIGLFALLFFNFILFTSLYSFFHFTQNNFSKALSFGLIVGQAGILTHGMTITNFYTILNMEALCVLLGLVMVLYYNEKRFQVSSSSLEAQIQINQR